MSQNLIITADDYSAHPLIDEGIETAFDRGLITTVSAFTNMKDSVQKISQLHERFKDRNIKIGVHLTITAGEAITGRKARSITDPDSPPGKYQFSDLNELPLKMIFSNLNVLEEELFAQIKVIKDLGIEVDHISCHHGILFLYNNLFKIVTDLACDPELMTNDRPIPIRPMMLLSKLTELDGYEESQMENQGEETAIRLLINNGFTAFKGLVVSVKKISDKMILLRENGFKIPDLMIDTYYKQAVKINIRRILKKLPRLKFNPQRPHFIENHPFKKDDKFKIYEMPVHLASRGLQTGDPAVPNGVEGKYFSGRKKELDTLEKYLDEFTNRFKVTKSTFDQCP